MKKIYLVLFFISCTFLGYSQINWQRSQANGNYPDWMGTDTERGMAYHQPSNKMYVVTRAGNRVRIINATTGADMGTIERDASVITGGTFFMNDVEVSANGAILTANLATNPTAGAFKIYKWDTETSTPTVYISYTGIADRLGDAFSVSGDISGNAVIFACGRGTANIVRWVVTGGVLNTTPTVITLKDALGANATQGNVSLAYPKDVNLGAASPILVNSTGNTLKLFNSDGTFANEEVPVTVLANSASDFKYFVSGGVEYIASYVAIAEESALINVTGGLGNAATINRTPKLGSTSNGNQAGGVGYKLTLDPVDLLPTIDVFTQGTNNGISGTTLLSNGSVLSNEKFSLAESKIYPNPASNDFQVSLANAVERNAEAVIYDVNGRQLLATKLTNQLQNISIANLSSGLYIVKVQNGSNQSTTKLLKK